MPFFVLVMFLKVIYEAIRVFREKTRVAKPEPLCVGWALAIHSPCRREDWGQPCARVLAISGRHEYAVDEFQRSRANVSNSVRSVSC